MTLEDVIIGWQRASQVGNVVVRKHFAKVIVSKHEKLSEDEKKGLHEKYECFSSNEALDLFFEALEVALKK